MTTTAQPKFRRGQRVRNVHSWASEETRTVLAAHRDEHLDCYVYEIVGSLINIAEPYLEAAGEPDVEIRKGICPEHGHVLWITDDPHRPRGCPEAECIWIVDVLRPEAS